MAVLQNAISQLIMVASTMEVAIMVLIQPGIVIAKMYLIAIIVAIVLVANVQIQKIIAQSTKQPDINQLDTAAVDLELATQAVMDI
jgi:hypothetical protein